MPAQNLHELLVEELKDLYSAETQLTKALPRMAKKAQDMELRTAFQSHLNETEQHVARLEQVCELLDCKPRGKKCVAMEGLIEEGNADQKLTRIAESHVNAEAEHGASVGSNGFSE